MKVALISTILPATNYSQYLAAALCRRLGGELVVYTDTDPANDAIDGCGDVRRVWPKSWWYVGGIMRAIRRDRPDVVHVQHEFNMYGGSVTAVLFPLLLWRLRRTGVKTVTTIHAVVDPDIVNRRFLELFGAGTRRLPPWLVRLFFRYVYGLIVRFSNDVIVHTRLMRDILIRKYGACSERIHVIPHGVPDLKLSDRPKEHYFLYFGYIARRKGLEAVIAGFRRYIEGNPDTDYRLVLAGGTIAGQEYARDEITAAIQQAGLENRVSMPGFIAAGPDLDNLFHGAAAVLIPAEISIAASGPMAQALRYGKCIVGAQIGNITEEIADGVDGLLVPNGQWDKAFEQIASEEHRTKIIQIEHAACEKARERNWEVIADAHQEVYNLCLPERSD